MSGQLSHPSASEQHLPPTGEGREGKKPQWVPLGHCCWEAVLFQEHKNKDEERASQGGAVGWGSERDRNLRNGGKQAKVEKTGKNKTGKSKW